MNEKFYVVLRGGKIWRVDDDGLLSPVENKQPGTLFDDYGHARNAIRRTQNAWKKLPDQGVADIPFEIKPLEF